MPRSTHDHGRAGTPAVTHATAFLDAQAACLASGLAHADAPDLVRSALEQHEAGHGQWLALIAWAGERDASLHDVLADCYRQHGRSAGALDRAAHPLLPRRVHLRVLALHARELAERTALARRALEDATTPAC